MRVVLALLWLLAAKVAYPSAGQPPLDRVRIPWPAEPRADCTGCHTGRVNGFPGTLSLLGLPAAYAPGASYDLLIELVDPDPTRLVFGFELAAVAATLEEAGTVEPADAFIAERQVEPLRDLAFARTLAAGSRQSTWPVRWIAPEPRTGAATFYACANAGDQSFTPFGDHVFCLSETVAEVVCDPPLPAVRGLKGVRAGADLAWTWEVEPLAVAGYRLYAVARKEDVERANGSSPGALRPCAAPSAPDGGCVETGAAEGEAGYFHVVGVCAAGQEGPN